MSISVRNLIQDALIAIKIAAIGQPVEASDGQIAVDELNSVISRLNLDDYFSFTTTIVEYIPSASANSYSIGLSGDIVTDRPIKLERVFYSNSSNNTNDTLFQISVSDIPGKRNLTFFGTPTYFAYDSSIPNGRVYFDCNVEAGRRLTVIYKKAIPQVNINSTIDIPSEYNDALKWTLCEILAGRYGKPQELQAFCSRQAQAHTRRIKSIGKYNDPNTRMHQQTAEWRSILTY